MRFWRCQNGVLVDLIRLWDTRIDRLLTFEAPSHGPSFFGGEDGCKRAPPYNVKIRTSGKWEILLVDYEKNVAGDRERAERKMLF